MSRFDVVAVEIATGRERFLAEDQTAENADAVVQMALLRRGVDTEFYRRVDHPHNLATGRRPKP